MARSKVLHAVCDKLANSFPTTHMRPRLLLYDQSVVSDLFPIDAPYSVL